jgi:hypothetical protein
MDKSKTFFTKIFGDEIGEMIQLLVGFFLILGIFMGFPYLIVKMNSPSSKEVSYKEILSKSRENTQNLYNDLSAYDSLTSKIEYRIDKNILKEKELINQKRELLVELQKDFDSVYLTSHQLSILSTVKHRENKITFSEWIMSPNQIYNIGVSLVISFIFFYLGKRKGKETNS